MGWPQTQHVSEHGLELGAEVERVHHAKQCKEFVGSLWQCVSLKWANCHNAFLYHVEIC